MGRQTSVRDCRQNGITLIECLVVVAILGVLVAIGVPSMAQMQRQLRGSSYVYAFMTSIHLTRSEAIKKRHRVTMCPSADGLVCSPFQAWSAGWVVFDDANANGLRDSHEALIAVQPAMRHGWTATGNTPVQRHISYVATGHSRQIPNADGSGGGFMAGTVTFCPPPGHSLPATRVVINSMGRPRSEKVTPSMC